MKFGAEQDDAGAVVVSDLCEKSVWRLTVSEIKSLWLGVM